MVVEVVVVAVVVVVVGVPVPTTIVTVACGAVGSLVAPWSSVTVNVTV